MSDLSSALYDLLDVLNAPWRGRWSDCVAVSVHRAGIAYRWLAEGENQVPGGTLCVGPAGARARVVSGEAFHVTNYRRQRVGEGDCLSSPDAEVLVLASFGALIVQVDYPLGVMSWGLKYFRARGPALSGTLERARRSEIMRNAIKGQAVRS